MAALPTSGINGRPVAISPRMTYPQNDQSGGDGLLSTLFCGGADSPFLLCDGASGNNEVDFDIDPTGVFIAVHTKQWKLASERVKVYPREASTWVVRYGAPLGTPGVPVGSGSSDRFDVVAVASPRSSQEAALNNMGPKKVRWRMLPIHAAVLFGAPPEVVRTLLKAYPPGCSAHDDQGMLPLHLAFRCGSSEEIALILLDAYPEAIERVDYKDRLPSMLAPKIALSYRDSIGEAFIKGPAYYYWASRVATADRNRSETAMTKQIRQIEENARVNEQSAKELLQKTEKQLSGEIEALSIENAELKERMDWYEAKYDGAAEKEKVLVDHANSLAERLRLTSLSEEHLATKLAKLETWLQNKEEELAQVRKTAAEEKGALEECVNELEKTLAKTKHKAGSLTEQLEKKIMETNEMKVVFDKERQLFEKQIDASKECLMELIASSKEDKRMSEEDSKELRRQLAAIQSEVQKASMDEKRMFEEDSQELRRQLAAIKKEVHKAAKASNERSTEAAAAAAKAESRLLEDKLDILRKEVANSTQSVMSHMNVEADERNYQYSSTRKLEDRLNSLQKEVANARSYMDLANMNRDEPLQERSPAQHYSRVESTGVEHRASQEYSRAEPAAVERMSQHSYSSNESARHPSSEHSSRSVHSPKSLPKATMPTPPPEHRTSQQYSRVEPAAAERRSQYSYSSNESARHPPSSEQSSRSARSSKSLPRATMPPPSPDIIDEEEDPFDTYVSTKASKSASSDQTSDQTRDDTEAFSHQSDVSTAMALGELSEDQRVALEQLDLSGSKEQIAAMLGRVPGLTRNQVNLLVDVASSLAV